MHKSIEVRSAVKQRPGDTETDVTSRIHTMAQWIVASSRLVVFTGAGISTDSGIPDYRGPDGVWTRRDKGLPPPPMEMPWDQVRPNQGHMAIVDLQEMGKLDFLISQNVDNLHRASGILPEKIAELHGNRQLMKCSACDRRFSKQEIGWDDGRWGPGYRTSEPLPGQPRCECGGRIISSVVNFGDPMPEKEMREAISHAVRSDLFVVVGSSLVVRPAADMPVYALRAGAKLVIINQGETPLDSLAHLRFWEGAGIVLPAVVSKVKEMLAHSR